MATYTIYNAPNKEPKWAFCGQEGYVGYSADGQNWSSHQAINGATTDLKEITYGGPLGKDKWAAAFSGGNDDVVYSGDITSAAWSLENPAQAGGGKRVKWDGSKWIVATSEWGPAIYHSNEMGQAWSSVNDGIWGSLHNLSYNGSNLWVAVGDGGKMATSVDATAWTNVNDPQFGTEKIYDVHYESGLWVAVGAKGKISSSTDGVTWTARTSGLGAVGLNSVTFGGGKWIAVGGTGVIISSVDGENWVTERAGGSGAGLNDVVYGDGMFLVGGFNGTLLSSTDGSTWTALAPANGGRNIYGVCFRS